MRLGKARLAPSDAVAEHKRYPVSGSVFLRGSRLFCVTTVSIVCTIKAPVPVRAEDGLDPPYLHGR
jgi:hypothetical protein